VASLTRQSNNCGKAFLRINDAADETEMKGGTKLSKRLSFLKALFHRTRAIERNKESTEPEVGKETRVTPVNSSVDQGDVGAERLLSPKEVPTDSITKSPNNRADMLPMQKPKKNRLLT
jgi:hypothetical protein